MITGKSFQDKSCDILYNLESFLLYDLTRLCMIISGLFQNKS